LANAAGAALLITTLCGAPVGAEEKSNPLRHTDVEPTAWQGVTLAAQPVVPPAARDNVIESATAPNTQPPATTQPPAELITPSTTPKHQAPLFDGKLPAEELMPPVVAEGATTTGEAVEKRGVQPYGGGHPTDWPWGCGGSPYRTGPGFCDNYRVGPRWHVTVDGMVMHREGANLDLLIDNMQTGFASAPNPPGNGIDLGIGVPATEQFNNGPGGRIAFMSQVGRCTAYDVQAVYEGINDWDASIVYPKQALPPLGGFVIPPSPNTEPAAPFTEGFQQRALHYRSNINSAELNFLPFHDSEWRPIFGARFIRFDDEISDSINQERQIPLPGPQTGSSGGPVPVNVNDPIGPTWETDRLNLFHLENNLMGFQIGLLHDTFQLSNRFAIEGFVSGGVYYNKEKYSNVMAVSTTQTFADNTRTTDFNEARNDTSTVVNNDARDLDEISYEAEASLTGVCRLNRCWALRVGYQILWIDHLHLAENAYMGDAFTDRDLTFHGWHAGIECRR
jgi:hypothetical protein